MGGLPKKQSNALAHGPTRRGAASTAVYPVYRDCISACARASCGNAIVDNARLKTTLIKPFDNLAAVDSCVDTLALCCLLNHLVCNIHANHLQGGIVRAR